VSVTVQEVLDYDSCSYNALVFEGFAHEGLQQPALAMTVYCKAASLEPNQPLAWQVVCAVFYIFMLIAASRLTSRLVTK